MARYMDTANQAQKLISILFQTIASSENLNEDEIIKCARDLAQVYNLGIRTAPRAVQGTVRLNAVREAIKGLPLMASLVEETDEKTGRSYKRLHLEVTTGWRPLEIDNSPEED